MHAKDGFPSFYIRNADDDLTVKSSRPQQGGIQNIRTIGGSQNNDAAVFCKSVHFNQQLVKRLFPFIVAAAQAGSSFSAYGIDLIDKYDARSVFLRLLKEISHPGSAHSYEHLYKVRTADGKKRNACFTGGCS